MGFLRALAEKVKGALGGRVDQAIGPSAVRAEKRRPLQVEPCDVHRSIGEARTDCEERMARYHDDGLPEYTSLSAFEHFSGRTLRVDLERLLMPEVVTRDEVAVGFRPGEESAQEVFRCVQLLSRVGLLESLSGGSMQDSDRPDARGNEGNVRGQRAN